jgi:heterodisulfide reductase subunit B2
MNYFYYPGCSLEGTAIEYDASTRAVMRALDVELMEMEDWTCCGASAGDAVSYLLSMVLPARNLALAERTEVDADFLVPCSACYLNLQKVEDQVKQNDRLLHDINEVLAEEQLTYKGGIKIRHLMDVLARDIGPEKLGEKVKRRLTGLRVAPYYGCQALRPYATYDDPEQPKSMEPLIEALGAEVHSWSMGPRCCGAGLMTTKGEVALNSVEHILEAASGADCIVTICPMCQMNLDAYQSKASKIAGKDLTVSVLYLPQLIGLAFGLSEEELKLKANFVFTSLFQQKLHSMPWEQATAS